MAKKKYSHIKNVVVGDIIRRHPNGIPFVTDMAYTDLANKVYDIITDKLPKDFTRQEACEICADIAMYCEDVVSGTHLFEAFCRMYRRMFHFNLPFYDTTEDPCNGFCLDALRFVVWHSIMCQNVSRVINPMNQGVRMIAEGVLELLKRETAQLPANEMLAEYLYSEEVQTDPIEVKKVLAWLMYESYLGHWELQDSQEDSLRRLLGKANDHMIDYVDRSLCAVKSRTWPLSLKAQTIYAEMIKIDMEDDDDELALAIEHLKSAPLSLYHIMSCDDKFLTVQDYKKERYLIKMDSFDYHPQAEIKRHQHTDVIASFISLDGHFWHVNGICSFTKGTEDDFEAFCQDQQNAQDVKKRMEHQYDDLINSHHGNRLFFFKDSEAYLLWLKRDLGLKNVDDVDTSILPKAIPVLTFIEPSGNMSLNTYAECIKHPDNKYYDPIKAREGGLQAFMDPDSCTPSLAIYLLENNLLPEAMLNDARGMQYGRLIMQDNIEFLARCIRRDIERDEPFTVRNGEKADDIKSDTIGKMSYATFIDEILALDEFRSKVHKLWQRLDASETFTIILDEKGNEFTIPTRELYEAHLSLNPSDISNKAVEPFISTKKNVPPATAILYNVMGRGKSMRQWQEIFKKLRGFPK